MHHEISRTCSGRPVEFSGSFYILGPKLLKIAAFLARLLPNIDGPGTSSRRLYSGVFSSMGLYGGAVCADALSRHNVTLLRCSGHSGDTGYRTISGEAMCMLAGVWNFFLGVELKNISCTP